MKYVFSKNLIRNVFVDTQNGKIADSLITINILFERKLEFELALQKYKNSNAVAENCNLKSQILSLDMVINDLLETITSTYYLDEIDKDEIKAAYKKALDRESKTLSNNIQDSKIRVKN